MLLIYHIKFANTITDSLTKALYSKEGENSIKVE